MRGLYPVRSINTCASACFNLPGVLFQVGILKSSIRSYGIGDSIPKGYSWRNYFLFAARGIASLPTWCSEVLGGSKRSDLLSPDVLRWNSARPERLKEYTLGQPAGNTIMIDKVQKVPDLLPSYMRSSR